MKRCAEARANAPMSAQHGAVKIPQRALLLCALSAPNTVMIFAAETRKYAPRCANDSLKATRTVYRSPWAAFRRTMANENDRSPFMSRPAIKTRKRSTNYTAPPNSNALTCIQKRQKRQTIGQIPFSIKHRNRRTYLTLPNAFVASRSVQYTSLFRLR